MVLLTSAAVVITGVAPNFSAISSAREFAPPRWPDKVLITKFVLSSITITAGSDFLSYICGAISLITAPRENKQISASFVLKSSAILFPLGSEYHCISELLSENFEGA